MGFKAEKLDANIINGGKEYSGGDALQPSAVNSIINGILHLNAEVESARIYAEKAEVAKDAAIVAKNDAEIASKFTRNVADYTDSLSWEVGSIYGDTGANYNENTSAIRTPYNSKIKLFAGTVIRTNNTKIKTIYVFKHDYDGNFIERLGADGNTRINITEDGLYRIVLLLKDNSVVVTTDTIPIYIEELTVYGALIDGVTHSFNTLFADYIDKLSWEVGSIYATGANYNENTSAIRTPYNQKIYFDKNSVVRSTNPYVESVLLFQYSDTGTFIKRIYNEGVKVLAIDDSGYYRIVLLLKNKSTTITSETINTYSDRFNAYGILADLKNTITSDGETDSNYVISTDFTKKAVQLEQIGSISGVQSFCKYNNKYYSTNGSNIYVQNSNLELEQTVQMSLGHGNAFHLGSGNIAYASGWDDQKVYCVNLQTLELVETITLPTSGYTTVAVDDVNKLMYIFQRDTSTNTDDYYNFIVYDYENSKIISTKKTTVAFGAMQGCDFFNGRIIVVNGIGYEGVQNGYRIYDTNGNILVEYKLPNFSSSEPEGVCIDRDSQEILISFVDQSLYRIK